MSGLVDIVDPRLTVGTARPVPCVDNTDNRQTAAAGQHWTGEPLKHRLSSLLSYLCFTTIKCYSIDISSDLISVCTIPLYGCMD